MFGEKILDYWDDILRDLKEIIAVPSVAVPQAGPYPFGKDAAAAIDSMNVNYMVGSLAGDDTAFLVMKDTESALTFCKEIREMLLAKFRK